MRNDAQMRSRDWVEALIASRGSAGVAVRCSTGRDGCKNGMDLEPFINLIRPFVDVVAGRASVAKQIDVSHTAITMMPNGSR